MTALVIALAGSAGAMSRFVLDGHIKSWRNHTFPWATVVINVSGSLLLGFVNGILLKHHPSSDFASVIGIGFCGGYTTFSTASFETVRLLERQDYKRAAGNAVGGLIMTIIAAAVGLILGQQL